MRCIQTIKDDVELVLLNKGIALPSPVEPSANYVGAVRTGSLLFVSGQLCLDERGALTARGKLGAEVSIAEGQTAAQACAVNVLRVAKSSLGTLDRILRVVRIGGFVNATPQFADVSLVVNEATDLMVAAFGEKGRHARTSIGVSTLPSNASVEIEAVFEVS
jgi:enamine deaminase RidA (YjgF/YER057c/UK114 family)